MLFSSVGLKKDIRLLLGGNKVIMRMRTIMFSSIVLLALSVGRISAAEHPMDGLSADEIKQVVQILTDAGHIEDSAKFPMITLQEMPKADVLSWRSGDPIQRVAFVNVRQDARVYEALVDITNDRVERWEFIEGVQTNMTIDEVIGILTTVKNDADLAAAFAKRGIDDPEDVTCGPFTAGYFGDKELNRRRIYKIQCYDKRGNPTSGFAKPIEGLYATIDIDAKQVIEIIDEEIIPLSDEDHSYDEASIKMRDALEPILVGSPGNGNVTMTGSQVDWQNWSFHLRFDRRVGPILSLIRFNDEGSERQIAYQLHDSEMFVPYMDPSAGWYWRSYMDIGEYGFGFSSSSLDAGTDCPETALFIDAVLPGDSGTGSTRKSVVCIFEVNTGRPLWRHDEVMSQSKESRPEVDLVVRTIPSVGNYDYVIDYVFTQRGNIRVDVGATGIDAVKGVRSQNVTDASATEDLSVGELVAPGLLAVYHDHYLSFRIDLDVDGQNNSFLLGEVKPERLKRGQKRKSIWRLQSETLATERALNKSKDGTFWRVVNENVRTDLGHHPGIHIEAGHQDLSLLSPDDYPQARAAFSASPLWITAYRQGERHAAGPYPFQSTGGDGLPAWIKNKESIDNKDVVVWYTVGFHHITRVEDWPVLPTKWHSFTLRPFNYFDRNPAVDVPSAFSDVN